ncbi:hypothetical protein CRE_12612 [Caenorhabditis remanei]|uniref:Protein kinase domain-containing protein n=1 Tax=Caenorhabditis remanei TaxID=31234 RepID=E3M7X8_CAERE|nr:hypothetical protein CRE_12612 [Caenorhabditis remanei]
MSNDSGSLHFEEPLCKECVSDKIEVVKQIGEGSFGSVYHVKFGKKKQDWAMKQVSTDYSEILKTSKEVIQVAHKNVIDFFLCTWTKHENETGGHFLIFMELCMEKTLYDWITENTTPESRNLEDMKYWIKQILSALHWFHAIGLIHRDLKPANIFFAHNSVYGARGTLKIGDLGMIKIREDHENLKPDENGLFPAFEVSKHTDLYGTEDYAAPELLNKQSYTYNVDIYSLGVIAAELIYPYQEYKEENSVRKALREGKTPQLFESFPKEVKDFLSKATKPNREDRAFAGKLLEHPFLSNVPTLERELNKNYCNDVPQCLSVDEKFVRVGFAEKAFEDFKATQISGKDKVELVEQVEKMQLILAGSVDEAVDYEKCSVENVNDYLSDLIYYGERTKHRKVVCFGLETNSFDAVKASYTSAHVKLIPSFEVWVKDGCREWMKSMLEKNSDFAVSNGNLKLKWIPRDEELANQKSAEFKKENEDQLRVQLSKIKKSSDSPDNITEKLIGAIVKEGIPEDRQCLIMRIDSIADFMFDQKIKVPEDYQETKNIQDYLRLLLGLCHLKKEAMNQDIMGVKFYFTNTIEEVSSAIAENSFSIPTFKLFLTEPVEHWESWSEVMWVTWVTWFRYKLTFERKKTEDKIYNDVQRKFSYPEGFRYDGKIVRVGFLTDAMAHLAHQEVPKNCILKTLQQLLTGSYDNLGEEIYHYDTLHHYVIDLWNYAVRFQSQKILCFSLENASFDKLKNSYTSSHVKLLPSFEMWNIDGCKEFMDSVFGGTEQLVFSNGNQLLSWIKREEDSGSSPQESRQEIESRLTTLLDTISRMPPETIMSEKAEILLEGFENVPILAELEFMVFQINILSCFLFGEEMPPNSINNTDEITSIKAYLRFLLGACKFITSWGEEDFEINLLNDIDGFSGIYITNCPFVLPTFEVYRMEPIEHWESWSEIAWSAWWDENLEKSEDEAADEADKHNTDSTTPLTCQDILDSLPINMVAYLP